MTLNSTADNCIYALVFLLAGYIWRIGYATSWNAVRCWYFTAYSQDGKKFIVWEGNFLRHSYKNTHAERPVILVFPSSHPICRNFSLNACHRTIVESVIRRTRFGLPWSSRFERSSRVRRNPSWTTWTITTGLQFRRPFSYLQRECSYWCKGCRLPSRRGRYQQVSGTVYYDSSSFFNPAHQGCASASSTRYLHPLKLADTVLQDGL